MKKMLGTLGLSLLASSTAWSTNYTVTTVDFPGSEGASVLFSINAFGRVVGAYVAPNSQDSIGFTEQSGVFTSVGNSLPCRPTRCVTSARLVNAFGEIAGHFEADVDFPGAFVQYGPVAAPHILYPPGYPNVAVTLGGLNDLGVLVGCYSTDEGTAAFAQVRNHLIPISVPFTAVSTACATGINNLGQVVGTYGTSTGEYHAFVETLGRFKSFEVPFVDDQQTVPVAISDIGMITGTFYSSIDGLPHGFLLHAGHYTRLDFPGALSTVPVAINVLGQVVGYYEEPAANRVGSIVRAFVYQKGHYQQIPLPGPAGAYFGINARGEIVGSYSEVDSEGNTVKGHGFKATPSR